MAKRQDPAELARELVESYINGNLGDVRDQLRQACEYNAGYGAAVVAYFVHYLPAEDHGRFLRIIEGN